MMEAIELADISRDGTPPGTELAAQKRTGALKKEPDLWRGPAAQKALTILGEKIFRKLNCSVRPSFQSVRQIPSAVLVADFSCPPGCSGIVGNTFPGCNRSLVLQRPVLPGQLWPNLGQLSPGDAGTKRAMGAPFLSGAAFVNILLMFAWLSLCAGDRQLSDRSSVRCRETESLLGCSVFTAGLAW
jgi:hypothetical protein